MLMKELHHKSVMIEEVLSILKPSDGKIYIDGTLGAGGHSKRILESLDIKNTNVIESWKNQFLSGNEDNSWKLWTLISYAKWAEINKYI